MNQDNPGESAFGRSIGRGTFRFATADSLQSLVLINVGTFLLCTLLAFLAAELMFRWFSPMTCKPAGLLGISQAGTRSYCTNPYPGIQIRIATVCSITNTRLRSRQARSESWSWATTWSMERAFPCRTLFRNALKPSTEPKASLSRC